MKVERNAFDAACAFRQEATRLRKRAVAYRRNGDAAAAANCEQDATDCDCEVSACVKLLLTKGLT